MTAADRSPPPRAGGTLYLLPCPIAATAPDAVLPAPVIARARTLQRFLVENAKSARAFLKALGHPQPLATLTIDEIGHAPDPSRLDAWLDPVAAGVDTALVSEAGCPAVADPGATLVARAHARGLRVQPLVGPSSLLLALMASGLDGQRFRSVGYLPREAVALQAEIARLERSAARGETQLFIETPYRSARLFETLLIHCAPATQLAVALDVTGPDEDCRTLRIDGWRALPAAARPAFERRPAVFALLAGTG